MRLSEAIDALAIATRADGRSPATVRAYREKLSYLVDFLADPPIGDIAIADLRRYVADLWDRSTVYEGHHTHQAEKRGLSPHTIAGRVRAFKRLFNWLVEEGVITENPARRIKTPKPKRTVPKGVEWEDVVAVLETCDGSTVADVRDKAVILLLTDTAARAGGVAGLRVQDVDLDSKTAWVTEKGGKTRAVLFTDGTARALADWLRIRPSDKGDWLFVGLNQKSKGQLTGSGILQMLTRRAKRAGVTGRINPHAFRHAFARHYLLTGGDLGTLSELLGHGDVSVTKAFYGIFTREELREMHARYSPIGQVINDGND